MLHQASVRTLIATPSFKSSDYAAMIDEVQPSCLTLRDVVLIGEPSWSALVARGQAGEPAQLDEIGATLSHHNILNNGYFVGELCNYTEADRICIPVPFYH